MFTTAPYQGNPVAVVLDGDGLRREDMLRFANWTNLSETTFVLAPTDPGADYQVRIFTPSRELSFAGHPTLGTCHAWLTSGGIPREPGVIVQQCGTELTEVRQTGAGLAFAAPAPRQRGNVSEEQLRSLASLLGVRREDIVGARWADNGPVWFAILLGSAEEVLKLRPETMDVQVGVAGPYPEGSAQAYEVRAFMLNDGVMAEDPVCGSFNASLAQWLTGAGLASPPYVVSQGQVLGRAGRVHISRSEDGQIWVGGGTVTCVAGEVEL